MYTAFTVYGTPAGQGSMKHVGKGRLVPSSPRLRPWREAVKQAALDAMEAHNLRSHGGAGDFLTTLSGPLSVEVEFTFLKPKSAPKKRRTWPITRSSGDIDKLCRAVLDGLVDAGLMRDDSQVVELAAWKVYVGDDGAMEMPGAAIRVQAVGA
ncbi:RusA family crossover junction endodeoxyribonuclease [Nonomuraea sediminis]|uniref:RusA family crossover junction endodeoxyribonuclease n=1 Tax=Nonomuraea sediminis TaxID=2835864 RepID=UPI0023DF2746|nr:RusA family crossover junction endodeoxyribonuclease [Nonomuraea sediminis]